MSLFDQSSAKLPPRLICFSISVVQKGQEVRAHQSIAILVAESEQRQPRASLGIWLKGCHTSTRRV